MTLTSEDSETTGDSMDLDARLLESFAGKVVRKDLTKRLKEGANVPVYVLEYLLGKYQVSFYSDPVDAAFKAVGGGAGGQQIDRILLERLSIIYGARLNAAKFAGLSGTGVARRNSHRTVTNL